MFLLPLFALSLLMAPEVAADAARAGLTLCGSVLVPGLFPWLALSRLALGAGLGERLGRRLSGVMDPLFHVGGAGGAAAALGLLGGYPSGAAAVRTLLEQGDISAQEAQSLLCFCNNAGPAFALSVAGVGVLGSAGAGMVLFLVHITAALLTGVLLRPRRWVPRRAPDRRPSAPAGGLLSRAVTGAMETCLHICAFVVFFHVILGLAEHFLHLSALPVPLSALLRGCVELSGGITALTGVRLTLALPLCAFLLGWGGVCVHCQTAAVLDGSGLSLAPYLRAKLLHGLLSAALCLPLAPALPTAGWRTAPVFSAMGAVGWGLWLITAVAVWGRGKSEE